MTTLEKQIIDDLNGIEEKLHLQDQDAVKGMLIVLRAQLNSSRKVSPIAKNTLKNLITFFSTSAKDAEEKMYSDRVIEELTELEKSWSIKL